jgi:hypothetical protein
MKRFRTSKFVILTLSLGVLSIYIITQGTSIPTTPANATTATNATQQDTSSSSQTGEDIQTGASSSSSSRLITNATKTSANQTGEDIQTDELLDRIKRGLTTPQGQSNLDEARQNAK